ncbi:MAG TPA: DinB family protein [Longimicrobiales bacterium]|nr:DinB family protein [Longimicrobiales bacterium]
MNIAEVAFGDFQRELEQTRKVLERLPEDKLTWKPHEKSMSLGALADHVARLPWFFEVGVRQDGYDMAGWQQPPEPKTRDEVLKTFDQQAAAALAALKEVTPESLGQNWSLKGGDTVYFTMPRAAVLRTFSISHIIHHRAQLVVYYRLVGVAVPGLYGPSADEQ